MLRRIEIGSGWTRYKAPETFIRPGEYYRCEIARPDERIKKALGLIAAQAPDGSFVWLCPYARWVKAAVSGLIAPEVATYGKPEPAGMWDTIGFDPAVLRPYQRQWVTDAWNCTAAGHDYRRAAIVGLGGGKTLMSLLLCQLGERPAVLAPRHVHATWKQEAKKWGLQEPAVTTYESAHRLGFQPDVLVLDECIAVKSPEALRSTRARELSQKAQVVVGLTGTPTAGGGPLDWRFLDVIYPGSFPTMDTSVRFLFSDGTQLREVAPGRKAYVTPASSWDKDKIAAFVAPYVFRVDTSVLLQHLPPIEYRQLRVPQPRDFEIVRAGGATEGTRAKRVMQTRMVSDGFIIGDNGAPIWVDRGKITAIREFVEGLGEPVVIYAAWRESVIQLARELVDYHPAVVSGDTTDPGFELKRFIEGDTDVLICNARYGSGIDGLQNRTRVIVFMSWSTAPVDRTQAIGRVFRHGQSRGCIVVDVLADGTMDDRVLELITGHNDMSAAMVERILAEEFGL